MSDEIDKILLEAGDSKLAMVGIFNAVRSQRPSYSIGHLARLAKIPSRGYIWEVVSGRKVLGPTYREKVFRVLGLTPLQASVLRTLIEIDSENDPEYRDNLKNRLDWFRKCLGHEHSPLPSLEVACLVLRFKVGIPWWARAGLGFEEVCRQHFPDLNQDQRQDLLQKLTESGWIIKDGEEVRFKDQAWREEEFLNRYHAVLDEDFIWIIRVLKEVSHHLCIAGF